MNITKTFLNRKKRSCLFSLFAALLILLSSALSPHILSVSAAVSSLGDDISMQGYTNFPTGVSGVGKFSAGVLSGSDLWMIPMNSKTVVRVNTADGSMTGYSKWPAGFSSNADYKFRSGVADGNGNIWMIPFAAESLVRLNTASGEMTGFDKWPDKATADTHGKFIGGAYYNGGLFMVPYAAKAVVRLDVASGTMKAYNDWPNGFWQDELKFSGGVRDGENLWLIPNCANMLIKMNLSTGKMTGYSEWPSGIKSADSEKFSGGVLDGSGGLWLIPNSAEKLVRVNTATGAMTGYNGWPSSISASQNNKFSGGAFDGKSIWLTPFNARALVQVNPVDGSMKAFTDFPGGYAAGDALKSSAAVWDGKNLWLTPYNASRLVQVSPKVTVPIANFSLIANTGAAVYAPGTVTIRGEGEGISKLEWFSFPTVSTSIANNENFASLAASAGAANKGTASGASITAATNGIYWVRASFADGTSQIRSIRIDNIYTPCLYISGGAGSANLYREPLSAPHGLPLEQDKSLVKSPSLGYLEISVAAKTLSGYTVVGENSQKVLLNSLSYLSEPGNTIVFSYRSNSTTVNPVKPPAEKTPAITPPVVKPPTTQPATETVPSLPVVPPLPSITEPQQTTDEQSVNPTEPSAQDVVEETDIVEEPPVLSNEPADGKRTVTYTLYTNFYKKNQPGYNLCIFSYPSKELQFLSGSLPAFTGGEGLEYKVLYRTNTEEAYKVLASDIPASAPYRLENPSGIKMSEIALLFQEVPAGFGRDNRIHLVYEILEEGYSHSAKNTWSPQLPAPDSNPEPADSSDSTSLLWDRVKQLWVMMDESTDPDAQARMNEVLAYVLAILDDPDAAEELIAETLAAVEAEFFPDSPLESEPLPDDEENNSESSGQKQRPPWTSLGVAVPLIISILSLLAIPAILLIRRRKKGALAAVAQRKALAEKVSPAQKTASAQQAASVQTKAPLREDASLQKAISAKKAHPLQKTAPSQKAAPPQKTAPLEKTTLPDNSAQAKPPVAAPVNPPAAAPARPPAAAPLNPPAAASAKHPVAAPVNPPAAAPAKPPVAAPVNPPAAAPARPPVAAPLSPPAAAPARPPAAAPLNPPAVAPARPPVAAPLNPPAAAPAKPPVAAPLNPPAAAPAKPPVAAPLNPPVAAPARPPVAAQLNPPAAAPARPPVAAPINPPAAAPARPPVAAPANPPAAAPARPPVAAPLNPPAAAAAASPLSEPAATPLADPIRPPAAAPAVPFVAASVIPAAASAAVPGPQQEKAAEPEPAKPYIPSYSFSDEIIGLISEISELAVVVTMKGESLANPQLRQKNQLQSIHSSLALENCILPLTETAEIINDKNSTISPYIIRRVKNTHDAYNLIPALDPFYIEDILNAHGFLMADLEKEAGCFRSGNMPQNEEEASFSAPPASAVPKMMADLIDWAKAANVHPLIKTCAIHHAFRYIQPFAAGNEQMGQIWQTLLLSQWKPFFAWLPVEALIYERQQEYHEVIVNSNKTADSTGFIEFMLKAIHDSLERLLQTKQVPVEAPEQVPVQIAKQIPAQIPEQVLRQVSAPMPVQVPVPMPGQVAIQTNRQASVQAFGQESKQITEQVKRLLSVFGEEDLSAKELLDRLGLKHRQSFSSLYLRPALELGLVEMTLPDKPNSSKQKYRAARS